MATIKSFRELALSFPEAIETPHFEKASFRVRKKIFATLAENGETATLKLSLVDQSAFCAFDPEVIHAVPNKWGHQGWTIIVVKKIKKEMLRDALTAAYCDVAPASLSAVYVDKYKNL